MTQRLDFIDVSHHQGVIDFNKVRSAGVIGVIMKATEGSTYVDDMYLSNRDNALLAGLKIATYHYLHHGDTDNQMQHYLDTVMPEAGERLVIDYEENDCNIDDLVASVRWLKVNANFCELTVYGSAKLTEDVENAEHVQLLKPTSLWIARYSSSQPEIASNVWKTWTAWQYSQTGTVPGVNGSVDTNSFNGSRENCEKWFGPVSQPEPSPQTAVEISINTHGQPVVVSIDGNIVTS